jgi:hypothetical protein
VLTTEDKEAMLAIAGYNIVGSGIWWHADMKEPDCPRYSDATTKFLMKQLATTAQTKEDSINKTWTLYLGETL